jgi:hypothetical protein
MRTSHDLIRSDPTIQYPSDPHHNTPDFNTPDFGLWIDSKTTKAAMPSSSPLSELGLDELVQSFP